LRKDFVRQRPQPIEPVLLRGNGFSQFAHADLGQRDVMPIELSGPNGKAVKISWEAIDEILNNKN
jgi:hypothetical protein